MTITFNGKPIVLRKVCTNNHGVVVPCGTNIEWEWCGRGNHPDPFLGGEKYFPVCAHCGTWAKGDK